MSPVTRDQEAVESTGTWRTIAPGPAELDPRGYARRRTLMERGLAILVPVALISLWQLLAGAGVLESNYFPRPATSRPPGPISWPAASTRSRCWPA
ncbi:hypothetical protein ACFSTC_62930 [Nonomuraea ferruginea]